MTWREWGRLAVCGALVACAGCATTYKRAQIPVGEWSGRGQFVTVGQEKSEEGGQATAQVVRGEYPTQLKIERAQEEGAVRIEITSLRGRHEPMEGDRTHLIAVLEPHEPAADEPVTLYRLAAFGLSFDEEEPELEQAEPGLPRASCVLADGDLILCIHYLEGFVDTFCFTGGRVYKLGTYSSDPDAGFIHWSEELKPKR